MGRPSFTSLLTVNGIDGTASGIYREHIACFFNDINTCSDEIDSSMVYCAAFGCNNQAKKGNGQVFFSFPKDSNLQKCGHITGS
jgi:hypothetical protein